MKDQRWFILGNNGMDAAAQIAPLASFDCWITSWRQLTYESRRWQSALEEALNPHALSTSELLVLWRTSHANPPGIAQVELSRELAISAAQVCGIVDGLADRGWLQRVRPQHDRRRLVCSLTPTGIQVLTQLIGELTPVAQRLLEPKPSPVYSPVVQQEAA